MLKAIAAVLVVLLVAAGLTSFVSKHMRQDLQETVSAAYTETRNDQLWCRAEIQHQLESVEDTALISIDDIMVTYQVCVDNIDEFPLNAFGATTP